jgi:pimeloyl-ACP methyl ester carboxylesterase
MAPKLLTALSAVLALAAVLAPNASAERGYYLAHHAPTSTPRVGNVLMIHGGGWKGDLGAEADQVMNTYIGDTRSWGYMTYNIGYRSGAVSLRDVVDAAERIVEKNPDEPLCLVGGSAGAQLALITAAKLGRHIDCVVDIGGPPDLANADPAAPQGNVVVQLASEAFGAVSRLARLSPINRVDDIRQPVLVVAPDCDYYTSYGRQAAFANALRRGEIYRAVKLVQNPLSGLLGGLLGRLGGIFGNFGFSSDSGVETGHCTVTTASFEGFRAAEHAFLDRNMH